jgi:hypothetical protein
MTAAALVPPRKATATPEFGLAHGFIYLTAVIFFLLGTLLVFDSFDERVASMEPDPLFGFGTGMLLRFAGALHLTLSLYLFAGRDMFKKELFVAWTGFNHGIYLAGLALIKAHWPYPGVRFIAWKLDLGTWTVTLWWMALIGYLFCGSIVGVATEWSRSGKIWMRAFMVCWQKIRLAMLSAKPTQETDEATSTKFDCPSPADTVRSGNGNAGSSAKTVGRRSAATAAIQERKLVVQRVKVELWFQKPLRKPRITQGLAASL